MVSSQRIFSRIRLLVRDLNKTQNVQSIDNYYYYYFTTWFNSILVPFSDGISFHPCGLIYCCYSELECISSKPTIVRDVCPSFIRCIFIQAAITVKATTTLLSLRSTSSASVSALVSAAAVIQRSMAMVYVYHGFCINRIRRRRTPIHRYK